MPVKRNERMNGNGPSDLCKELHAKLARLEEKAEANTRLLEERDRRYAQEWESQRRETLASFKSAETAIQKAEASQKDYNEKSNEFRQTLSDQAKTFVSMDTYTVRHEDLIRRIDTLEKINAESHGHREASAEAMGARRDARTNRQWLIGITIVNGLAIVGLALALLQLFNK